VNVDSLRKIRPPRPDSVYNGADDDGSGSVGLLEVAEYFATLPVKPKRSLLFVWHTGEEAGLLGSRWFTDNPTVPLDSVVGAINIDMISTSEIKISVIIKLEDGEKGTRAVHQAFLG
jgi:Zn-dependent M28 family amino/carboxypeptidase